MPTVPSAIAIAISDLHLSLLQPACRADKDWMAVQAGYLDQVKKIERELAPIAGLQNSGVPILCAGDIFDRWNAPPELINFALKHLPDGMICVPGQHDLPNHRTDQVHRSGYGVLKEVGKIVDISGKTYRPPHTPGDTSWQLQGFEWGREIKYVEAPCLSIALIHRYCWTVEHGYPGAPESSHLGEFMKPLKGYDVAVFGDNHKGFLKALKSGTTVLNVGGFIRRKSDEIGYNPSVGIIYSDGTVKRKLLDTSADKFHEEVKERDEVPLNMKEFIDGLEGLGEHGLNFREAVENHLRDEELTPAVKQIIKQCLEQPK